MNRSLLVVAITQLTLACAPATPAPAPATEPLAPLDIPRLPPTATAASARTPPAPAPPPPPEDPAAAEALFAEGRAALARGDLTTARAKLAESLRIDPAAGTALNLADVEARLGDVPSARRHYQEAFDRAMAAGQRDRAVFAKSRLDALPP